MSNKADRWTRSKLLSQVVASTNGTTDIDISEADYTGYVTLLTVAPATGYDLLDCTIDLDWNKATTGFDTVATAADTLDSCVVMNIDGTNYRTIAIGTQITANGDGSLEDNESGQRFNLGFVPSGCSVIVKVKLSAERDDVEIPYRVTYRSELGKAPTVTAVAAA